MIGNRNAGIVFFAVLYSEEFGKIKVLIRAENSFEVTP